MNTCRSQKMGRPPRQRGGTIQRAARQPPKAKDEAKAEARAKRKAKTARARAQAKGSPQKERQKEQRIGSRRGKGKAKLCPTPVSRKATKKMAKDEDVEKQRGESEVPGLEVVHIMVLAASHR